MTKKAAKPIEIFYSYAHEDEALRNQLNTHLATLRRQGLITEWYDRQIQAGAPWSSEIDTHLKTAQVILLLISPDFINSDYCYSIEMDYALQRHNKGEARVVPVLLRPVDWKGAPFEKLQALPRDARPVIAWSRRDDAFLDVARGIRDIVEELTGTKAATLFLPSAPKTTAIAKKEQRNDTQETIALAISKVATASYRKILSDPPSTRPDKIQQREEVVKDVYARLTQSDITAIALTGIGGVGKSMLASLVCDYAKKQSDAHKEPFQTGALWFTEAFWFTVDQSVTFADLVGNLCEALHIPLPDLSNSAPQNQAKVLFDALNKVDTAKLVILNQFEDLLDWGTGHASTDRPGVGEWLDIINNRPCLCRILLTSRPRPIGTQKSHPIYMQEYLVGGLNEAEGVEWLQSQGVRGTEMELHTVVKRCKGHALALTLLVTLVRDRGASISALINESEFWIGDVATELLDKIYKEKLDQIQRKLLIACSAYREPVPFEAIQAAMPKVQKKQVINALNVLFVQRLIEAPGGGDYQLHAIIADYIQNYNDDNKKSLRVAHTKATQYYLQRSMITCPLREQRRSINDVHDLIEAIWQYCQAGLWREAYKRIWEEGFTDDLAHWGGNATLLELYQLLLPLNKWQADLLQTVQIYIDLGGIYRDIGQKKLALEYYKKAMTINEELGNDSAKGQIFSGIGSIYDGWGERVKAIEYYEQALLIYRELKDREKEAWVLNSLGRIYTSFGVFEQAEKSLRDALDIRKDAKAMGRTLNNRGDLYIKMGKKEEALDDLKNASSLLEKAGDLKGQSRALHRLGQFYSEFGSQEEAIKYYKQTLEIRREKTYDHRGEGRVLGSIGLAYATLGQDKQVWEYYNQAQEYYKQALPICKEEEDSETEGRVYDRLGMLYLKRPSNEVALACFLLASDVFEKAKNPEIKVVQGHLESLRQDVGEDYFAELLVEIKPHAEEVVNQALTEEF